MVDDHDSNQWSGAWDEFAEDPHDGYCYRCDDTGTILVCVDDMCRGAGWRTPTCFWDVNYPTLVSASTATAKSFVQTVKVGTRYDALSAEDLDPTCHCGRQPEGDPVFGTKCPATEGARFDCGSRVGLPAEAQEQARATAEAARREDRERRQVKHTTGLSESAAWYSRWLSECAEYFAMEFSELHFTAIEVESAALGQEDGYYQSAMRHSDPTIDRRAYRFGYGLGMQRRYASVSGRREPK